MSGRAEWRVLGCFEGVFGVALAVVGGGAWDMLPTLFRVLVVAMVVVAMVGMVDSFCEAAASDPGVSS